MPWPAWPQGHLMPPGLPPGWSPMSPLHPGETGLSSAPKWDFETLKYPAQMVGGLYSPTEDRSGRGIGRAPPGSALTWTQRFVF